MAALLLCLSVMLLPPAVAGLQFDDTECAFTDNLQGVEPHGEASDELRGLVSENGTVRCRRGSRCYGLWEKREGGEIRLAKQGCWMHIGDQQECLGDRCLVTATPSQVQNGSYRFCCCSVDMCNVNFTEAPPTADTPPLRLMKMDRHSDERTDQRPLTREETVLVALVTVAIAAILIMALFLAYRIMEGKQKHMLSAVDVMEAANTDSAVDLDNLKLLELIGRGRYGAVFRGDLNERRVAVKLFGAINRQNFANECSIYRLPLLQHDNISRFLAADERTTADGASEFLIVMEYYPQGCLSHFLSVRSVDWTTCCRMCQGVTRGLSFLHTELHRADRYKPAVAHRDVSSRNVLVRDDLSCVLADFGLSMRLTGHWACRHGDDETLVISEVGTVRYMAPEVLGGALNLRDCESALKQVDVYALGLLFWETFRRCVDLFPGGTTPEYQLAFQEQLGNQPTLEEMQNLVFRLKHRPRFPESWGDNTLSLRETIEDCWDQDAEARLTAQCADERLTELALMNTHTLLHNHRNLSYGQKSPQIGSASSYFEDLQFGVVKNVQGDTYLVSDIKIMGGVQVSEKNKNHERQQSRAHSSSDTSSVFEHSGGALATGPVYLQFTEEDLEAVKLDPKEVEKNLNQSSDENLMECSQKQFTSHLFTQRLLLPKQVHSSVSPPLGDLWEGDAPPSSMPLPRPKQQNRPQRPKSLHLTPKTTKTITVHQEKFKSNHRQVETGIAKVNTVTVAAAGEPHLVTNNTCTNGITATGSSGHRGIPIQVSKSIREGRTNLAGPDLEDKGMEEDLLRLCEGDLNLLNFSPDEHQPLLPAQSQRLWAGQGSNSNNNNNKRAMGSEVKSQSSEVQSERIDSSNVTQVRHVIRLNPEQIKASPSVSGLAAAPQAPLSDSITGQGSQPRTGIMNTNTTEPGSVSAQSPWFSQICFPEASGCSEKSPLPLPPDDEPFPSSSTSCSYSAASLDGQKPAAADSLTSTPPEASVQDPEDFSLHVPALEPPVRQISLGGFSSGVLVEPSNTRRPKRPTSLDLSIPFPSTYKGPAGDPGILSTSGEKIRRRVKTPYMLKKWRPSSWVMTTDTAVHFGFNTDVSSSSQSLQKTESVRISKINQSKSSMAVFWVGGGAMATATSDRMGSF